jgi:ATP synthase protein I
VISLKRLITYATLGLQVGFTVAGGVLVGILLDRFLGTSPWLAIVCLLVALFSGLRQLYKIGKRLGGF